MSQKIKILIVVLLILSVYSVAILFSDFDSMVDTLLQTSVENIIAGALLAISVLLMRFIKWVILLPVEHRKEHKVYLFLVYIAGFAFTVTPGKVGENFRNIYLHKIGINHTEALLTFILERYLDLLSVMLIIIISSYSIAGYEWLLNGSFIIFLLMLILFLGKKYILQGLVSSDLTGGKIKAKIQNLLANIKANQLEIPAQKIIVSFVLSVLTWAVPGCFLYLVIISTGNEISLLEPVMIYACSLIAGLLSLLPAGLGAFEGVMVVGLGKSGIEQNIAIYSMLILRLFFLWGSVLLGLFAVAIISFMHKLDLK